MASKLVKKILNVAQLLRSGRGYQDSSGWFPEYDSCILNAALELPMEPVFDGQDPSLFIGLRERTYDEEPFINVCGEEEWGYFDHYFFFSKAERIMLNRMIKLGL